MPFFIETDHILFFVRLILGAAMIYYGFPKVKNLRANGRDFVKMGFRPGMLWGTIVAFVEFFGGLAVLAGFFTEFFAAAFGFQMLTGTFWKLKVKKPFTDYSYDIQLLALAAVAAHFGPGLLAATGGFSVFILIPEAILVAAAAAIFLVFVLPLCYRGK